MLVQAQLVQYNNDFSYSLSRVAESGIQQHNEEGEAPLENKNNLPEILNRRLTTAAIARPNSKRLHSFRTLYKARLCRA